MTPHGASPAIGTVASLQASASQLSGLSDFGADDYTDGLAVLLESYAAEAGLTPLGTMACMGFLTRTLVARLHSEAAWQSSPSYAGVPVRQPIFITGLPRTGTTALHRLMMADPASQGLELWLAAQPQPRPPRQDWASYPAFQRMSEAFARYHSEHSEMSGVHFIAPEHVEECFILLVQSMRSVFFECLAHLPSYSSWLVSQDWTAPYLRHRRNLQLIGMKDGHRRWVLKNPGHLFALDGIMQTYPDALVIVTHRDPRAAIASMCSLAATATDGWSSVFQGPVIGSSQLALWKSGVERFNASRDRYAPERFADVAYDDLVADPIGVVERVYASFGLPLSGAAVDAMRASTESGAVTGAAPAHKYTLAEFGLTAEQVSECFPAEVSAASAKI